MCWVRTTRMSQPYWRTWRPCSRSTTETKRASRYRFGRWPSGPSTPKAHRRPVDGRDGATHSSRVGRRGESAPGSRSHPRRRLCHPWSHPLIAFWRCTITRSIRTKIHRAKDARTMRHWMRWGRDYYDTADGRSASDERRCRSKGRSDPAKCRAGGASNPPVGEGQGIAELLDTLEVGGVAGDQLKAVLQGYRRDIHWETVSTAVPGGPSWRPRRSGRGIRRRHAWHRFRNRHSARGH